MCSNIRFKCEKSAIRYAFRNAKESYMEHGLTYPILFKQNIQMKCTCKPKTLWKNISEGHQFPISISYPTVPSTIWPIFSEFLIFYCLISRAFSRVKQQKMRNEENIGHIVRDKHAITSLSLSWKISAFCYCNSTLSREKTTISFFLQVIIKFYF